MQASDPTIRNDLHPETAQDAETMADFPPIQKAPPPDARRALIFRESSKGLRKVGG